MIIDCASCTVRGPACSDCVVTFLTIPVRAAAGPSSARRPPGWAGVVGPVELDADTQRALDVLAASGLVPPLRLEPAM